MQARREEYQKELEQIDPKKLIFLDESGATTKMTRTHGRAPEGKRVYDSVPNGHWNVTTMVGAISLTGVVAGLMFDGATNTESFATFIEKILAKNLKPGDVVVMDNLSSHKSDRVRQIIEAKGARLLFLPPYSPDFNPIEKMWSKVKKLLRDAGERTKNGLWNAICSAWKQITVSDCKGYFQSCGLSSAIEN